MACGNTKLCGKVGYCEMAAYCKRVHSKLREEFLKTTRVSAINVKIFEANGSGTKCTKC